jgi:hypothetical protein
MKLRTLSSLVLSSVALALGAAGCAAPTDAVADTQTAEGDHASEATHEALQIRPPPFCVWKSLVTDALNPNSTVSVTSPAGYHTANCG